MTVRDNNGNMDQGWSWMVLVGACLMAAITDGLRNSSGIFFSQFIDTMHLTKTEAATVIAILNGMFMLPGPIASSLAHRLGTRTVIIIGALLSAAGLLASGLSYSFWPLIITFGGVTGLGCCLSFVPTMGALNLWFTKYRQLAPAACMASGALGIFAIAPLTQLLVDAYSWRGAVIVLAGIALQTTLTGMVYFPRKRLGAPVLVGHRGATTTLFKNPSFCLHLLHGYLMFGVQLYFIFIVRHVTNHRDFTPHEASALVSVCGIASFFGRLSVVAVNFSKKTATRDVRFVLFNFASFFGAIASAVIPLFWNFYAVAVVSVVMGFMQGVKLGAMLGVTLDVAKPKLYQTGYGYFHLVGGLSVVTAAPFAGFLAERFASFDPCFYLSAVANFLSFLCGMIVHYLELRKEKRTKRVDGQLQKT